MATTYYVDVGGGDDTKDGKSVANAWASVDKFLEDTGLGPGDKCILRRAGTVSFPATGITIKSVVDGSRPIVFESDDGTAWPADKTALSGTFSPTFGSHQVTTTADQQTALSSGKGLDLGTGRVYEVDSVPSDVQVNLHMPYVGDTASGLAGSKLPTVCNFQILSGSKGILFNPLGRAGGWHFKTLSFDGTGQILFDVSSGSLFPTGISINAITIEDCEFSCNGADTNGLYVRQANGVKLVNSRLFNMQRPVVVSNSSLEVKGCLFDSNDITGGVGLQAFSELEHCRVDVYDSVIKRSASADVRVGGQAEVRLRNTRLLSTTTVKDYRFVASTSLSSNAKVFAEDWQGTIGDNRVFLSLDETEGVATLQSETNASYLRSGGGTKSLKVTPSGRINDSGFSATYYVNKFNHNELEVLSNGDGVPIQINDTLEHTVKVWVLLPSDNFSLLPINSEFHSDMHYWGATAGTWNGLPMRKHKQSNAFPTVTADVWSAVSVTFTPVTTGVAYLRLYYGKPLEPNFSNVFYVDPMYEVT